MKLNSKMLCLVLILAISIFALSACSTAVVWRSSSMIHADVFSDDLQAIDKADGASEAEGVRCVYYKVDNSRSMRGFLADGCDEYNAFMGGLLPNLSFNVAFIPKDKNIKTVHAPKSDQTTSDRNKLFHDNVCNAEIYNNNTELGSIIKNITQTKGFKSEGSIVVLITDMLFEEERVGDTYRTNQVLNNIRDYLENHDTNCGIGLVAVQADYAIGSRIDGANRYIYYVKDQKITGCDSENGKTKHPFYMLVVGDAALVGEYMDALESAMEEAKQDEKSILSKMEYNVLNLDEPYPELELEQDYSSADASFELSPELRVFANKENLSKSQSKLRLLPPGYVFYKDNAVLTGDVEMDYVSNIFSEKYPEYLTYLYNDAKYGVTDKADMINRAVPIFAISDVICKTDALDSDELYVDITLDFNNNISEDLKKDDYLNVDCSLDEVVSVSEIEEVEASGAGAQQRFESAKTAKVEVIKQAYDKVKIRCYLDMDAISNAGDGFNNTILYKVTTSTSVKPDRDVLYENSLGKDSNWLDEWSLSWNDYRKAKRAEFKYLSKTPNLKEFIGVADRYADVISEAMANAVVNNTFYFAVSMRTDVRHALRSGDEKAFAANVNMAGFAFTEKQNEQILDAYDEYIDSRKNKKVQGSDEASLIPWYMNRK